MCDLTLLLTSLYFSLFLYKIRHLGVKCLKLLKSSVILSIKRHYKSQFSASTEVVMAHRAFVEEKEVNNDGNISSSIL